ncbi:Coat F domain-containing protein [Paenibacillus sp. 1_12]|uniref:spore coat protein n=1 Tax=Paenibacillus sp. 1_12 TaxID=1566278 RepID=UPI0008ED229A|nr:spore coat protein [Paenibacillus sp. 1_12]SFL81449.1 Coat F domain-containing protein [Paenibacillus sp. 1_12]
MNQNTSVLPEREMLLTILCELKRTSREYTTAVTESNCSAIRQTLTSLLHSTLESQEKVYGYMKQNNMYKASSPVLRQEVDKKFKQNQQTQQEQNQFVQSRLQGRQPYGAPFPNNGNTPSQHQSYMM